MYHARMVHPREKSRRNEHARCEQLHPSDRSAISGFFVRDATLHL
jgi:hypothetical protein